MYFQIRYFRLVYENLDADSNGSLNAEEVREALEIIVDTTLTDEEFQLIFGQMDRNQNGSISFKELKKYFKKQKGPRAIKNGITERRKESKV